MKIAGWFRRNNTIMAQAKDLQRQWQEMRDENRSLKEKEAKFWGWYSKQCESTNYLRDQLHRVARERDNERKLRLEAEDKMLDYHVEEPPVDQSAELERLADELADAYSEAEEE